MNDSNPSGPHKGRRIVIAVVVFLLASVVGLIVWRSTGPFAYASGHRWALYPSTSESPESDGSSAQEKLAFDGNIKVLSLLHTEHLTKGAGERIREVVCHVVVCLPPNAAMRITGGGSTDEDGFDNYKTAKIIVDREGDARLEFPMKVAYRFADDSLQVKSSKDSGWSSVAANPGNVYIVHVNENGTFDEWLRSNELIDTALTAADVERVVAIGED